MLYGDVLRSDGSGSLQGWLSLSSLIPVPRALLSLRDLRLELLLRWSERVELPV